MEQCKNLHDLVEELIKAGRLKQYVCTLSGQNTTEATKQALLSPTATKVIINCIHGVPVDDKYHSKR